MRRLRSISYVDDDCEGREKKQRSRVSVLCTASPHPNPIHTNANFEVAISHFDCTRHQSFLWFLDMALISWDNLVPYFFLSRENHKMIEYRMIELCNCISECGKQPIHEARWHLKYHEVTIGLPISEAAVYIVAGNSIMTFTGERRKLVERLLEPGEPWFGWYAVTSISPIILSSEPRICLCIVHLHSTSS